MASWSFLGRAVRRVFITSPTVADSMELLEFDADGEDEWDILICSSSAFSSIANIDMATEARLNQTLGFNTIQSECGAPWGRVCDYRQYLVWYDTCNVVWTLELPLRLLNNNIYRRKYGSGLDNSNLFWFGWTLTSRSLKIYCF